MSTCGPAVLDTRPCRVDRAATTGTDVIFDFDFGEDLSLWTLEIGLIGKDGVALTPDPDWIIDDSDLVNGHWRATLPAEATENEPLGSGCYTWTLAATIPPAAKRYIVVGDLCLYAPQAMRTDCSNSATITVALGTDISVEITSPLGTITADQIPFNNQYTSLTAATVGDALDQLDALVLAISGATPTIGTATLLDTNLAIAADGTAGRPDPLGQTAGWYYKNSADLADKINWYYLAAGIQNAMSLQYLQSQWALIDVRAGGAPFFVIYTRPQGDGQDAATWFRSRLVYAVPGYDISGNIGETIVYYWGQNPPPFPGLTRVEATLDTFSTVGPQGDDEEILFGNISTSTGYPAGTYEFVIGSAAFKYAGKTDQYQFSAAASTPDAPTPPDDAYIELDGVNDYISLSGTGNALDYSSTWTLGFEMGSLPTNLSDSKFMTLFRSGDNSIALRRGGTNWGFYAAAGPNSVAQANTWVRPSAGSRILIECDGTRLKYYLDGVKRADMSMNSHKNDGTGQADSIDVGRGGVPFGQGAHISYEGGIDNMLLTYNMLSAGEVAEFFTGPDVTNHSYYAAARDFVQFGEAGYPNVIGEKNNVTGSLVNGTPDDFVERT